MLKVMEHITLAKSEMAAFILSLDKRTLAKDLGHHPLEDLGIFFSSYLIFKLLVYF